VAGTDPDRTFTIRQRLQGVLDDVYEDLAQVGIITLHRGQPLFINLLDCHGQVLELVEKNPQGVIDRRIDIDRLHVGLGLTRQIEQAFNDVPGPLQLFQGEKKIVDHFIPIPQALRPVADGFSAALQETGSAGQGIVQFVGRAGDELADRRQTLRLD